MRNDDNVLRLGPFQLLYGWTCGSWRGYDGKTGEFRFYGVALGPLFFGFAV